MKVNKVVRNLRALDTKRRKEGGSKEGGSVKRR